MKRKLLPVSFLLLLFIGCDSYYMICSLNPFYIERNIVLEPQIEGSWSAHNVWPKDSGQSSIWGIADTASTWNIKRYYSKEVIKNKKGLDSTTWKPENYYVARFSGPCDSSKYAFKVVLFRVNRSLYADFIPKDKNEILSSVLSSSSLFEVHTLARVKVNGHKIQLSWLGADCMKEMIEKKRVRVNYQWVKETGRFILTASYGELTIMLWRYADQPRFIDWENQKAKLELNRIN
jgi:hypothetical protein